MALVVRDGNGNTQNLPNAGIDNVYYYTDPGTITTTATSATDVYQFKGAAGVVSRLRKIEFWAGAIVAAATTFAATTTLVRLLRRTTAGTTGTWTAATDQGSAGIAHSTFAAAAPSSILNVAGTTAFTVGTGVGIFRTGYVPFSQAPATNALNTAPYPLVWLFGVLGNGPVSFTGTSDYIVVNLNGVTPIGPLQTSFEFEEATV